MGNDYISCDMHPHCVKLRDLDNSLIEIEREWKAINRVLETVLDEVADVRELGCQANNMYSLGIQLGDKQSCVSRARAQLASLRDARLDIGRLRKFAVSEVDSTLQALQDSCAGICGCDCDRICKHLHAMLESIGCHWEV